LFLDLVFDKFAFPVSVTSKNSALDSMSLSVVLLSSRYRRFAGESSIVHFTVNALESLSLATILFIKLRLYCLPSPLSELFLKATLVLICCLGKLRVGVQKTMNQSHFFYYFISITAYLIVDLYLLNVLPYFQVKLGFKPT
jgi:hypothetical protein